MTNPALRTPTRPVRLGGTVVVSTVASDSHTWNLVFLQLLLEEQGYDVVNLGPCVPTDLLVGECRRLNPDMIVVSSVNGHGCTDGVPLAEALRGTDGLADVPMIIGGKLGVSATEQDRARQGAALLDAGFDAVFEDAEPAEFRAYLQSLAPPLALA